MLLKNMPTYWKYFVPMQVDIVQVVVCYFQVNDKEGSGKSNVKKHF